MKLHIMTWNTQLYEYGNIVDKNKAVKPMDYIRCNEVIKVIKKYIDESENGVAVLQEIPFRNNITHSEHIIFSMLCGAFSDKQYTILYNINERVRNQIKMTAVISKKDFVRKDAEGINSNNDDFCNCFVSFVVNDVKVLAVHQSLKNGEFLCDKIRKEYVPDIILGDFNAGNYTKEKETKEFICNREKYRSLLMLNGGYKDVCEDKYTTICKKSIDHILISNKKNIKCTDMHIDYKNNNSDHYPIYCEIITS